MYANSPCAWVVVCGARFSGTEREGGRNRGSAADKSLEGSVCF